MFNIETVENLAKISGDNLISLYLNTDKNQNSSLEIKAKVKTLFKLIDLSDAEKKEYEDKINNFIDRISAATKSIAFFISDKYWNPVVFPFKGEDSIYSDSFFNLEPLLFLLNENRNIGVLLLDSEKARFLSIFLGDLKDHRFIEDKAVRRQANGGWSKERFERKIEKTIHEHLKHSLEFLKKMHKIYYFEYLFLRSDPEIEHEFVNVLTHELKSKLRGHLRVDMDEDSNSIVDKAIKLMHEKVAEDSTDELKELTELLKSANGRGRAVSGIISVFEALYNKKVDTLFVNEEYSEPGSYCQFCGYMSLVEDYCPYDLTPNNKVRNIISYLVDESLKNKVKIEVLKNNAALMEFGNIAATLKDR